MSIMLLGLAGCQSIAGRKAGKCDLKPGLTTDELAACGCFPIIDRSNFAAGITASGAYTRPRSVVIFNYFCPIDKGIARVVVVNGKAKEVFK